MPRVDRVSVNVGRVGRVAGGLMLLGWVCHPQELPAQEWLSCTLAASTASCPALRCFFCQT